MNGFQPKTKKNMFTGIVEETGEVSAFDRTDEGGRLAVVGNVVAADLSVGDSLAVNGCCLTVSSLEGTKAWFDLLQETISCTSFETLRTGDSVNLERSLAANGRIGGHFLSGHVDEAAKVTVFEKRGDNHFLEVETTSESLKYLVSKGSIAIDGVSLTVFEVDDSKFSVWLIPHTLEVTTFDRLQPGNLVNLEFDLLAKYVENILNARS